jgi:hypothetical protein
LILACFAILSGTPSTLDGHHPDVIISSGRAASLLTLIAPPLLSPAEPVTCWARSALRNSASSIEADSPKLAGELLPFGFSLRRPVNECTP